jgi:hypothetical protein
MKLLFEGMCRRMVWYKVTGGFAGAYYIDPDG